MSTCSGEGFLSSKTASWDALYYSILATRELSDRRYRPLPPTMNLRAGCGLSMATQVHPCYECGEAGGGCPCAGTGSGSNPVLPHNFAVNLKTVLKK